MDFGLGRCWNRGLRGQVTRGISMDGQVEGGWRRLKEQREGAAHCIRGFPKAAWIGWWKALEEGGSRWRNTIPSAGLAHTRPTQTLAPYSWMQCWCCRGICSFSAHQMLYPTHHYRKCLFTFSAFSWLNPSTWVKAPSLPIISITVIEYKSDCGIIIFLRTWQLLSFFYSFSKIEM